MRALLLTLLLVSSSAMADDATQFLTLEQHWVDAAMQRDIPTLKAVLADDFVDVSYKGTLRSKADHLQSSLAPSKTRQTLEELKVRLYGDTGIVNGVNVIVTADALTTYKVRFTDVLVKRAGRWQPVSAQETLEDGS